MAFKGLEDRFLARQRELYEGTAKNSGTSAPSPEPFVEFKPTDGRARETANDNRLLPVGSIRRDLSRMTNYLRSGDGVRFLASQALLQSGNAFAETRIYNPLFVIGNVQPYRRVGRNLSSPSDFPVSGETKSPASTVEVGRAGRLQRSTADRALARVVGGSSGIRGLLASLIPQNIVRAVSNTFSVVRGGSTGQDQRPEFRVNNTLYSIAIWQGFVKQPTPQSSLRAARANLRTGNIRGAIRDVRQAASTFIRGIRPGGGLNQISAPQGRTDPNDFTLNGRRYFITNARLGADRYLRDSVMWDVDRRPDPSLAYLDRKATAIRGNPASITAGLDVQGDDSDVLATSVQGAIADPVSDAPTSRRRDPLTLRTIGRRTKRKTEQVRQKVRAKSRRVERKAQNAIRKAIPDAANLNLTAYQLPQVRNTATFDGTNNPAEEKMLFPELSLRRQYLDSEKVGTIKVLLDIQKKNQFDYWNQNKVNRGFRGASELKPGVDAFVDSNKRNSSPSYIKDTFNAQSVFGGTKNDTEISKDVLDKIKKEMGDDLINVFFFDFVNKATIPFRAFISNVGENVMPEISDSRYIGRIDRNVVYVGVQRELSFQLRIHAMSSEELAVIWRKINYLTGLCYPAKYDNYGFMIPPFVKLTIGDVWRDQPGYIKSLSHTLEDGTPWEITEDYQAPHGILVNITFAILESQQRTATSQFYPVGRSRQQGLVNDFGQLPTSEKQAAGTGENTPKPTISPTEPKPSAARPSTSAAGGGTSRVVRPTTPPVISDNAQVPRSRRQSQTSTRTVSSTFRGFGGGGGFSGGGGGTRF